MQGQHNPVRLPGALSACCFALEVVEQTAKKYIRSCWVPRKTLRLLLNQVKTWRREAQCSHLRRRSPNSCRASSSC